MLARYRYFALVSCSILAYFVISSQYLYQNFGGKHSLSLQNATVEMISIEKIQLGSTSHVHTSDGNPPNTRKGDAQRVESNELNKSSDRVVVDVKYSTSVVETRSEQTSARKSVEQTHNSMSKSKSPVGRKNDRRKDEKTSVMEEKPPMSEQQTRWFQIIKDAAAKFFNLISNHDLTRFRKWAVDKEREFLKEEMKNFHFKPNTSLKDYVMEKGGQPIRNVIFTTWRSGSTFLGEILDSHPGTYYHYEPLLHFGLVQVRYGKAAKEALRVIRELLHCRYNTLGEYMKNGETQHWVFNHNTRVWTFCMENRQVCWDPKFLTNMCRMFPFQALKTVRMRLDLARPLLQDKKLNVRVLYLVRDPRGTIQSRFHRDWCPGNPDCEDPSRLCDDLVSDYEAAEKLREEYPERFMLVRYEDMAGSIYNAVKKILKFFRLEYHPQVQMFLDIHTKSNIGGVSSTFRDTKSAPFHWIQDLATNFSTIESIQNSCKEAMDLWGYDTVQTKEELEGFNPVKEVPWADMEIEPVS